MRYLISEYVLCLSIIAFISVIYLSLVSILHRRNRRIHSLSVKGAYVFLILIIVFNSSIWTVLITEKNGEIIRGVVKSVFVVVIGIMLWHKDALKKIEYTNIYDMYDVFLAATFVAFYLFFVIKYFSYL